MTMLPSQPSCLSDGVLTSVILNVLVGLQTSGVNG